MPWTSIIAEMHPMSILFYDCLTLMILVISSRIIGRISYSFLNFQHLCTFLAELGDDADGDFLALLLYLDGVGLMAV